MIDLVETMQTLQAQKVSLLAVSGLQFDLSTPHGKLVASVLASLAEFERDLLRERVKSGLAAARDRGVLLGRQKGQRPVADKHERKILEMRRAGQSYRAIAEKLRIDKNTVWQVLKRAGAEAT